MEIVTQAKGFRFSRGMKYKQRFPIKLEVFCLVLFVQRYKREIITFLPIQNCLVLRTDLH